MGFPHVCNYSLLICTSGFDLLIQERLILSITLGEDPPPTVGQHIARISSRGATPYSSTSFAGTLRIFAGLAH